MSGSLSGTIRLPRSENGNSTPKFPVGPVAGIILLSAAIGAGTGAGIATLLDGNSPAAVAPAASVSAASPAASGSVSIADLYAALRPSVVKITAVSTRTGEGGTGSGLVLDSDGHIATNYHVVQGADRLDVRLADGTTVLAEVVGTDPGDDLAVIQVGASGLNLTPVKFADASKTRVGDSVVAIGNPLDLEATLTEGVVSGLGRVLSDGNGRPLRQLIQTDSAINPGNSGGGLFNLNGELVGITNALENPSGQDSFSGIGYAIPVSTLQRYLPDMLAGKAISHAKLGVSLGDLTPAIASDLGVSVDHGVLIGSVDRSSAAAKAGLQGTNAGVPGDVIVAIDGHEVKAFDDLAGHLDTKNPGDGVTLSIVRGTQRMEVNLQLDAWTS